MIESARRLLLRYSYLNWALADQTMVSGVNFMTGILIARYLGVTEFGRFTLVWMAVLFVNSLQSGDPPNNRNVPGWTKSPVLSAEALSDRTASTGGRDFKTAAREIFAAAGRAMFGACSWQRGLKT